MPSTLISPTVERLVSYLHRCGGVDRFEFHDGLGQPDLFAARDFAEELREKYRENLDHEIRIEQRANRIDIRLVA